MDIGRPISEANTRRVTLEPLGGPDRVEIMAPESEMSSRAASRDAPSHSILQSTFVLIRLLVRRSCTRMPAPGEIRALFMGDLSE